MVLRELLTGAGYGLADMRAVALATEGLEPAADRILAISVAPMEGDDPPATVYIEGGNALSSGCSGINPATYRFLAVSPELAVQEILEMLGPSRIVVGHNLERFAIPFLDNLTPRLMQGRIGLDTMLLARTMAPAAAVRKAVAIDHVRELDAALLGVPYDHARRWGLEELCKEKLSDSLPRPVRNVFLLRTLFRGMWEGQDPIPARLRGEAGA